MTGPIRTAAAAALALTWAGPIASRAGAQDTTMTPVVAQEVSLTVAKTEVPWGVGERLVYDVGFGPIKVGTGSMQVAGIEKIRGFTVYHTTFRVKGGTFFYRVNDLLESWFDTETMSSLQFRQDYQEGGRSREKTFMMYPERKTFTESGKSGEQPSVENPLDDGSFLYFIRTVPLEVGKSYEFHRYFRPDRNPVKIKVLRKERVKVPAGTFEAFVIQPIIKAKGIFSDKGEAQIWLAADSTRIMLQMKSKLSFGTLNLYLKSYTAGTATAAK